MVAIGDIAEQVNTSVSSLLLSRPDLCGMQNEEECRADSAGAEMYHYREVRSAPSAHLRQVIKSQKPLRFVTERRVNFRAAAQALAGSFRLQSSTRDLGHSVSGAAMAPSLGGVRDEAVAVKDVESGRREESVAAALKQGGGVDLNKIAQLFEGKKTKDELSNKFVRALKSRRQGATKGRGTQPGESHGSIEPEGKQDEAVIIVPILLPPAAGAIVPEVNRESAGIHAHLPFLGKLGDEDDVKKSCPIVALIEARRLHVGKMPKQGSSPYVASPRPGEAGFHAHKTHRHHASHNQHLNEHSHPQDHSHGLPPDHHHPTPPSHVLSHSHPPGLLPYHRPHLPHHHSHHHSHHTDHHDHHKGKSKGYFGVSRKERIHHEFEGEDQGWLCGVAPLVGAYVQQCDVNMMFEGVHNLLPELSQESQSRDGLLHMSCARLRDLLRCRKVIFMEVDASNYFAVAATSDASSQADDDAPVTAMVTNDSNGTDRVGGVGAEADEGDDAAGNEKMPGGCEILPLDPDAPGILISGLRLQESLASTLLSTLGTRLQVSENPAHAHLPGFMRARMAAKQRDDEKLKLQELARKRWATILGSSDLAKSLLSQTCVDEAGRMHGAFVAVDHRVDALPTKRAMEFNNVHAEVLQGVSRHVASLLTSNEESTAKSARLQSSNQLISALQDVALCSDTERLFDIIRQRFPPLTNCQDMTLFIVQQVDGQRVLYSQGTQARYDMLTHIHALFVSCCSSNEQYAGSNITSKALAGCLEHLRIVPAKIRLDSLYKVLAAAKVPIQRVTRGEGSGYGRRKASCQRALSRHDVQAASLPLPLALYASGKRRCM